MALLAVGAGCDQSKAELDQTKTQLQAVTTERDALKSQVASLQQQLQQASAQSTPSQPPAAAPATRHGHDPPSRIVLLCPTVRGPRTSP